MIGARPVRAARGTTLTARSWQTEAPLRMLMNNLDPDVAERPDDLVVYGGTGRAARDWAQLRRHRPHPHARWGTTRRCSCSPGRPVGVHADARVGAARAHRQLQPRGRLGDVAGVPPARAARPDDVRADDRRVVDLHRHAGDPAGHLRDVRRRRREAVRRHARRHADRDRRLRRDGRRPAARRHAQRRRLPRRRRRPRAAAPARREPLPRRGRRRPRRRRPAVARREGRAAGPVGRAGRQLRGRCCPSCCAAASRSTSSPTRPRRTTRCRTCRPASSSRTGTTTPQAKPEEFTDRARASMARHVEAMVGFLDAGAEVFDYGNSIRDEARQGGYERAFAFPGFVPAYIRPLFCEGKGPFRWAALSGDPRDIAATDRAVLDLFPDNDHLHRWIRAAQERVAFQGLPARICWLGQGERDRAGAALQRDGRLGRARRARSSSAATTSTPGPWRRRTGRPRRCSTAPTRSPTGRCSTPSSTRRAAPPGCRSTTAAGSGSAARSTPAR